MYFLWKISTSGSNNIQVNTHKIERNLLHQIRGLSFLQRGLFFMFIRSFLPQDTYSVSECQIILEFYRSGCPIHSVPRITRYIHVSFRHEAEFLSWRVGPTEDLYLNRTEHTKIVVYILILCTFMSDNRRNEETHCVGVTAVSYC